MFGMGGTEILVILIVALLFLGPDKLPDAAKKISKGIRDIKKQSRALQRTIEDDEHIGGAIRDLRSALRGEDEPYRPPPPKPLQLEDAAAAEAAAAADQAVASDAFESASATHTASSTAASDASDPAGDAKINGERALPEGQAPTLTLPPTAGEPDGATGSRDDAELAALVKPAPNTIARGAAPDASSDTEPKHG